jgi:hypothetical protein
MKNQETNPLPLLSMTATTTLATTALQFLSNAMLDPMNAVRTVLSVVEFRLPINRFYAFTVATMEEASRLFQRYFLDGL